MRRVSRGAAGIWHRPAGSTPCLAAIARNPRINPSARGISYAYRGEECPVIERNRRRHDGEAGGFRSDVRNQLPRNPSVGRARTKRPALARVGFAGGQKYGHLARAVYNIV